MNSFKRLSQVSLLLAVTWLMGASSALARTFVGGVQVLAPDELVAGKTQAEYADLWWQYVISIPKDDNPLLDTTGEDASIGQSGPVFFLAGFFGTSSEPIERTIEVPANKYIFLPLVNQTADNSSTTDDPTNPNFFGNLPVDSLVPVPNPDPSDVCTNPPSDINPRASLRNCAASIINTTDNLFTSINGVDVKTQGIDLFKYRQKSPKPFCYTVPVNNILGYEDFFFLNNPGNFTKVRVPGTIYPVVADGYWLMLAPLPPGQYTLNFGGSDILTSQNNTYYITSVPESSYFPHKSTNLWYSKHRLNAQALPKAKINTKAASSSWIRNLQNQDLSNLSFSEFEGSATNKCEFGKTTK